MSRDAMGDRLKYHERMETERTLNKLMPVYARLDGRAFSKYTAKGFERPYDKYLAEAMVKTTQYLVKETGAIIGYTQSDEISLGWVVPENENSEMFFKGKIQKLCSTLAGMASAKFNREIERGIPPLEDAPLPVFDCRIHNVPDNTELMNCFLWRTLDARKNSISMLAQHYFSHKDLQYVNSEGLLEKLETEGVHWDKQPDHFKLGTFIKKEQYTKTTYIDGIDCSTMRTQIVCLSAEDFLDAGYKERVEFVVSKYFKGE